MCYVCMQMYAVFMSLCVTNVSTCVHMCIYVCHVCVMSVSTLCDVCEHVCVHMHLEA